MVVSSNIVEASSWLGLIAMRDAYEYAHKNKLGVSSGEDFDDQNAVSSDYKTSKLTWEV
jgi:hypothetical protein